MDTQNNKAYLGDGVYIEIEEYQYKLIAENNIIYLNADTIMNMLRIILPPEKYNKIMNRG